ncbi:DHA2 family efflux MFS transporter permease subunit [Curtanaerobium respiraculi]|uniref:DHA2 family efflux MFS transporter permease subunit n=1 Tax=Curtanaerobium respiraculi TaxID=2949669 RepID=UPI0024B35E3B|nr:DHA2 family efflux MFS transporter permease subunit [Curtanaerobium respiraculi]
MEKSQQSSGLSYLALAVMVVGTSLGGMSQTGMNTALPQIMSDTGVSVGVSQWLVTLFQLCLGITMPTVAFLSKRFTAKSLFIASTALFALGSFIIAAAQTFPSMVVGRVLEGIGAGVQMPLVQMVVFAHYPRERWGTIMGFAGLAFGFSPNIGPMLVGVFIQSMGWRSAFVFFGALSLLIALIEVAALHSETVSGDALPLDIFSLLLSIAGFGILLLGFANVSDYGFASWETLVPLAVGLAGTAAFFAREVRVPHPLLDMAVFRDRDFTVGTIMVCLLFCAFIGVTLVIPLGLQKVQGFSALEAGMALLPGTVSAFIVNPLSGILYDRFGARPVICVGALLLVVGTVGMHDLGSMTDLWVIMGWQAVRAFGISALIQLLSTWSVHRLDAGLIADGTSVSNAFRQVAAAAGTSIMVILMAIGGSPGSITALGVDVAVFFSFVCSTILCVLAFAFVKKERR